MSLYRASVPPQRPYREPYPRSGDPFREVGVHALYLLSAILGPIRDAELRQRSSGNNRCVHHDEWTMQLECERGLAQILLTWSGPEQQVIAVQGERGRLQIDLWPGVVTRRAAGVRSRRIALASQPLLESASAAVQVGRAVWGFFRGTTKWYCGIERMIEEFYAALRHGSPMPVYMGDVHQVVEWNERAARSVEGPDDWRSTSERRAHEVHGSQAARR